MQNIGVLYEVPDRTYTYAGCIDGKFIVAFRQESKQKKETSLLIHEVLENELDTVLDPKVRKAIEAVIQIRNLASGKIKSMPPLIKTRTISTQIKEVEEVVVSEQPKAEQSQTNLWENL